MIVNRITSHYKTNKQKYNHIIEHFEEVKNIKNKISEDIFNYIILNENIHINLNYFLLKEYREDFKQEELSKWELQKITKSIVDFYSNYISKITKNKQFKIQKSITKNYYKKNTKSHKKGELKEYTLNFQHTINSNILNYLKYIPINNIIDNSFSFENIITYHKNTIKKEWNKNKNKEKKHNTIKKIIKKIRTFQLYNKHYKSYNNKKKQIIINTLKSLHKRTLKHFKSIEFETGAYIKAVVFNKNNPKTRNLHSYVFKDETNSKYKYWYKFKTEKNTYYLPLSYNQKYHNDFNNFLLEKETYVSLSPTGKININLYKEENRNFKGFNGKKIACDLNVRDNFLTFFDGNIVNEFDYDRTYIHQFLEELKVFDNLSKEDKKLEKNKYKLEKIIRRNEWYFKKLISNILNTFKENGVSEITLEDLDLTKSSASYIKSKEFNIKYSRLIRMLRLSKIKDWFKEQAFKKGIVVHLTNPAYSSQECSACHHIQKENRKGDTFECKKCNHKEHSDYNSCKTLYSRTFGNVSHKLHNSVYIDKFVFLISKKIQHKKIKLLIEEHYSVTD